MRPTGGKCYSLSCFSPNVLPLTYLDYRTNRSARAIHPKSSKGSLRKPEISVRVGSIFHPSCHSSVRHKRASDSGCGLLFRFLCFLILPLLTFCHDALLVF